MAKNRYLGSYPVIGIRPTIDGRRGALKVREGLEDQTMNMAKSAAKLFEENLRYSNGEPVKVVIADTTIGRVAEAAACEEKFRHEGVAITLTVTPCWCYGSETMDMDRNTIKAVWGFNGTERPGAVYLASVLATHAQKGLPAFGIYGHEVQEADDTSIPADVQEKLLRFGRAAVAAATMRGKSYLQIGAITMGIGGSIIDSKFIEDYLGMRVESVDEVEVIRRMTRIAIANNAINLSQGFPDFDPPKAITDRLAEISGLGAVDELLIGVYDVRAQRYASHPFAGVYEITSLSGNLTLQDGAPHAHLHVTAGDIHGNAVGGHLLQATVSAAMCTSMRLAMLHPPLSRVFHQYLL